MVKHIFTFNIPYASISSYDVSDGLRELRSTAGVTAVQMLRSTEGQSSYLLVVDADDEQALAVRAGIEAKVREYSSYLQDVTVRSFQPLA